jgi:hypothetical protein
MILATATGAAPPEERVPDEKRVEVFRFLAARNEANYRKIETWQGSYRFVDRFPRPAVPDPIAPPMGGVPKLPPEAKAEPKKMVVIREGVVEFALDMAADKLWVNCREDGSTARLVTPDEKETYKPGSTYGPVTRTAIITADSIVEMHPSLKFGPLRDFPDDPFHLGQQGGRLAERRLHPDNMRRNQSNEIVDPRHFYRHAGKLYSEHLHAYADQLEGKFGAEAAARLNRDCGILKRRNAGDDEYIITIYFTGSGVPPEYERMKGVFRLSERSGFLPVEITQYLPLDEVASYQSWIYRSIDGIHIPKEFHYTHNDNRNKRLVLDRHLVLVEAKLNQPIPAEVFSTEGGLQLARGDRFVDRIEQRLLVHDGAGLVAATQYDPVAGGAKSRTRIYLALGSAVLLGLVCVWVARRKVRRPAAGP